MNEDYNLVSFSNFEQLLGISMAMYLIQLNTGGLVTYKLQVLINKLREGKYE